MNMLQLERDQMQGVLDQAEETERRTERELDDLNANLQVCHITTHGLSPINNHAIINNLDLFWFVVKV